MRTLSLNIKSSRCSPDIAYKLRAETLLFDKTMSFGTNALLSSRRLSGCKCVDIIRRNFFLVNPGGEV